MTQLVQTRRRYAVRRFGIRGFLRGLGIPFSTRTNDFWTDNHLVFPEIYAAMKEAARDRMAELHPDRGGDAHSFGNFVAHLRAAQKYFRRYIPLEPASPSTVIFKTKRQIFLEKQAAKMREWRRKNRKHFRAVCRARYARKRAEGWRDVKNPERIRRYKKRHRRKVLNANKRWRLAHPEIIRRLKRESYHRRKAFLPKRVWRPCAYDIKRTTPGTPEYEHARAMRKKRAAKKKLGIYHLPADTVGHGTTQDDTGVICAGPDTT
jgi:hypothetical protein